MKYAKTFVAAVLAASVMASAEDKGGDARKGQAETSPVHSGTVIAHEIPPATITASKGPTSAAATKR